MSDLAELFARDPLELSQKDLDEVISHLRASRHQFNAGNAQAGRTKPTKVSEKAKAAQKVLGDLDLGDL